jgi:hypothetical protein
VGDLLIDYDDALMVCNIKLKKIREFNDRPAP